MTPFNPPRLLRNRHLQSIFASTGPRKLLLRQRARRLQQQSQDYLLHLADGTRLLGRYAQQPKGSNKLVMMIHGWEGSADSLYLQSAGSQLFKAGFDVFRLNLRDHGPTHHLNRELFNSTRLQEVLLAIQQLQQREPHQQAFLVGFSLGGNFALRVAADAAKTGIALNKVVAVCPVINPVRTMDNLCNNNRIYHDYFHRKWSRSLQKKLQHFPDLNYGDELLKLKNLRAMNDYFVPRHTDYADSDSYLRGYGIGGERLKDLAVNAHIISAEDDPVILAEDLNELTAHPKLHIELTRYGGHCGYIKNYRLESWVDQRLLELLR
jgi:hypothetical protein